VGGKYPYNGLVGLLATAAAFDGVDGGHEWHHAGRRRADSGWRGEDALLDRARRDAVPGAVERRHSSSSGGGGGGGARHLPTDNDSCYDSIVSVCPVPPGVACSPSRETIDYLVSARRPDAI